MTVPPQPAPSGIQFGIRRFTDPIQFSIASSFKLPAPGIYAILVRDLRWTPRPFRILYFGESAKLTERVTTQHEKYLEWVSEAAGNILYVAYHFTVKMTDQQRRDAECELINTYQPPCNVRVNLWPGLRPLIGK
jgi:hypothetical protein